MLSLLLFILKGRRDSAGTAKGQLGFGHLISWSVFHVRIGLGADRLGYLASRAAGSMSNNKAVAGTCKVKVANGSVCSCL